MLRFVNSRVPTADECLRLEEILKYMLFNGFIQWTVFYYKLCMHLKILHRIVSFLVALSMNFVPILIHLVYEQFYLTTDSYGPTTQAREELEEPLVSLHGATNKYVRYRPPPYALGNLINSIICGR